MKKQELLEKIQQEAAIWEAFLAEVGEERMEQPGAMGEWTFKDAVAHLSGWRGNTLAQLEAAARGDAAQPRYWPGDWDEESDEGVEQINQWMYAENRDRPLYEVLDESRYQFRQLAQLIDSFTESDLTSPDRFAWRKGKPLAALVDSTFGHFHEEHEPGLREWLAKTPR